MAEQILSGQKLTVRGAVATVQIACTTLLESAGITDTIDLDDLSVCVTFKNGRIDIAKVTEDGKHIEHWVCGFSIDPTNLSAFGTLVPLPGEDQQTH